MKALVVYDSTWGFIVSGQKGPLADGEIDRAAPWGRRDEWPLDRCPSAEARGCADRCCGLSFGREKIKGDFREQVYN
jgi:hypothetical protein